MKEKTGSTKTLIAVIAIVAAVIVIGVIAFFALNNGNKSDDYRSIRIYEIDGGDAQVERGSTGVLDAYIDMMLQSGDKLSTFANCYLQLQMDDDKYMLVEPDTRLTLTAAGNAKDSRTTIDLEEGGVVNQLNDKLSEDSEYVVNTPNSTMAVRGTCFRVYVYYGADGKSHTILQVFEGIVECRLIFPDNTVDSEPLMVMPGTKVAIWGDSTTSEYEYTDGTVDYSEFELEVLDFLRYCISDLKDDFVITWDATFTYGGSTFGTQQVVDGGQAVEPELMPAPAGHWDFDFDTEFDEDKTINWVL